jgi:hypothetical protein
MINRYNIPVIEYKGELYSILANCIINQKIRNIVWRERIINYKEFGIGFRKKYVK